jgi:PAS domain S-box-containing protein
MGTRRRDRRLSSKASPDYLSRALEVGQIGWWRLDTQHNRLIWSDETHRIFGVPKGKPLSYESFVALVHSEDRQYVNERWQAGLQGEPYDIEHRIVVDGQVKWVREKAYLELSPAGTLLGGFGIVQDVTARKQAELELRQSEELFKAVFESSSDCILVWDRQYNYLYANQAAIDHVGTSRDKVIGKNIRDGLEHIPDFMRLWMGRIDKVFASGRPFRVEDAVNVGDRLVFSESAVSPIRDAAGDIVAVSVVYRDISARKQSEANRQLVTDVLRVLTRSDDLTALVRESLLRVRQATGFDAVGLRLQQGDDCPYFEASGFDIAFVREENSLCARGADGAILRDAAGNRVLECTCGLVLSGRTDPTMSCFTPEGSFWTNRSRELLALAPEADPRTSPRNRCMHLGYQSIGLFPIRAGDAIIGLLQLNDRREGRFDPEQIGFFERLANNIGLAIHRCMAEEALRQSEEKYRALFESIDQGFCIVEVLFDGQEKPVDYRFLLVNPAFEKQTGIPHAVGRRMREIAPLHEEHWFQIYGKIALTGVPMRFENPAVQLHRHYDVYAWRVGEPAERKVAILLNDISERKRAEERLQDLNARLQDADRRKDEFIAILSHELRNPLAPVRFAVPILAGEQLSRAGARALAVIDRQADHLTRLVDDLLDVSRITHGKIELRREFVTVASVVSAALEAASPAIAAGRHWLKQDIPDEPIWLHGDPKRLAQVIGNLLHNSAKYSPQGAEIEVVARCESDGAVIRVRDSGIGIPPEALPAVFDMFRQVDLPNRSQGGLGVGLALVKRLVEMHGGSVEAHSDGVGCGAEFTVRLPIPKTANEAAAAETPDVPPSTRSLRVLLVDDNADLLELLATCVEAAGHTVRRARDGQSAVSVALSYRPDVMLVDLGLPGLSGIEVARELRRHPEMKSTRLVALTGWGQPEDRRRTEEAGFDRHLIKPVDADAIERLLAEYAAATLDRSPHVASTTQLT